MALLQVSHRCPHCSELKDFVISQASEILPRKPDGLPPLWTKIPKGELPRFVVLERRQQADDVSEYSGLSRCPHCTNPVLFVLLMVQREYTARRASIASDRNRDERIPSESFTVLTTYPQVTRLDAHASWPEKIRQPFVEMQDDVRRGRTPAFIIGNCRTILEAIMSHLGGKGPTLEFKIKDLRDKRLITLGLAEWAEKLRGLGNTAVHDFEGDAEDAKQLVEFIKLLLHVTFEVPAGIRETAPNVHLTAPDEAIAEPPPARPAGGKA